VISAELPDKLTAWRRGKGNHKKDDIWSRDVGKIRERGQVKENGWKRT
jgi:hypothetical protein